jgi:hypothetical protein
VILEEGVIGREHLFHVFAHLKEYYIGRLNESGVTVN